MPQPVERHVRGVHRGGDPRAVLTGPGRLGAGGEHLGERGVRPDVVGPPAKHLLQAPRHVQPAGQQDEARVRGVPEDGLTLRVPGEDAAPVPGEEARRREVSPDGQEARPVRPLRRRKGLRVLSEEEHRHARVTRGLLVASGSRRAPLVEAPKSQPRHPRADARPRVALARVCPPRPGQGPGGGRRGPPGVPGLGEAAGLRPREEPRPAPGHASRWCGWRAAGCSTA